MKKIFLLLLIIPITINAENITTFSIDEISASAGNNITVDLNMDNNQEFSVLTIKVHYDNTKLEYISSEMYGLNATLRGTDKNSDKGIVALYAINLNSSKKMNDSGKIMTIEFKIKDDVTVDLPLNIEIKDFSADETNKLKYKVKDGLIKIKNNVNTVTKNDTASLFEKLLEETKKEGLKNEDVTWSTTDDNIASVDSEGNVTFKDNGNVEIFAKDSTGAILYSKEYYVNSKLKNKKYIFIAIGISIAIVIILLLLLRRKKCQKRK